MPVVEEVQVVEELEQETVVSPRAQKLAMLNGWLQTSFITAALFFLVTRFVAQGFAVSGCCMEPNLVTGERVLGNKLSYAISSPSRGDVVVFKYPVDPTKTYIKRVIGLPGETVEVRSGRVYIDGTPLSEPYVVKLAHGDYGPEKVKSGRLFVMGDYRDESSDSRVWGELPEENIKAKAWVRYWPPRRAQVMP